MICVLLVASGATWEPTALGLLSSTPDVVVLKRCVDVDDLLASAASGQADVAVVALDAPGLDATAVRLLQRHRVRPVAVVADEGVGAVDAARARAARWGLTGLVPASRLDELPAAVLAPAAPGPARPEKPEPVPAAAGDGRVVAVWGPRGAPGRTLLAVNLAAALAARGRGALLVDADPYGGAVAQQLGILDEVSGLLAAARLAATGELADRLATVQRTLGPGLSVLTGLPRADRWVEVRPAALTHLLDLARHRTDVVVDTGFSLEPDPAADLGGRPARNGLTLAALETADRVVVVGAADPVGLARLARGLTELHEVVGGTPVHVVVNRYRPTLGWSEAEVTGTVQGFAGVREVHVLPEDRTAADRAALEGRTLVESGDSPLLRAVAEVADAVLPSGPRETGVRPRRAGRDRRR